MHNLIYASKKNLYSAFGLEKQTPKNGAPYQRRAADRENLHYHTICKGTVPAFYLYKF
jgi:hypothetical protein